MREETKRHRPAPIDDEDTVLVRAIIGGERARFQSLVEKYQQQIFRLGLRMCGERRDAEDLVQETFINVFRYLEGFRYEAKFKNWLFRIATTTCLKRKRKRRHAPARELSLEDFMPQEDDALPETVPTWARLPLEQVLNEELAQHLQTAIAALPKKYRMVVALRDMEGFSTEETAEVLNLSTANVKVRLHRARLFLRDKLKGYFAHAA
jgi:RNA polymerase sigma-70 factor (ECF subfamily)